MFLLKYIYIYFSLMIFISPIYANDLSIIPTMTLNVIVQNNKTSEEIFSIIWDKVPKAQTYNIYKVTLSSLNASIDRLQKKDFIKIATSDALRYKIQLKEIPFRRYVFLIEAVDTNNKILGVDLSEIVWRYPATIEEFIQDVDFTMLKAHTKITNFGIGGSRQIVKGRVQGEYNYFACLINARSIWKNYANFEIILNGIPKITTSVFPIGALMNGAINISGLYEGQLIYNNLLGQSGAITSGGSITARYKHPKTGWIEKTFSYKEASKLFKTVILSPKNRTKYVYFEQGKGI